jgi:Protein of unknown function (DUF2914)
MKPLLVLIAIAAMATTAFAQTDTTATTAAPTEPAAAAPTGEVKRAQFCSGVAEREPLDDLTTLAAPAEKVFFFTELIGMGGKTVTHKWSLDGQTMGEVAIAVGGDRWRCYSTKTLAPGSTGTWTVQVVDDAGNKLAEKTLTYTAAP